MNLKLKRGSGRKFDGSNWKLASDKKWEVQTLFVPHALEKEKYVGNRSIDGVEHAVFLCLNDEFFAQPVSICELPKSENVEEIFYTLEAPVEDEKAHSTAKNTQGVKILQFAGKNWKLAADKKWKSTTSFLTYEESDKVGEKVIGQTTYDIYRGSSGFVAVKREE